VFIIGIRCLNSCKRRLHTAFMRRVTAKTTNGGLKSFGKGKTVNFNDGTSEIIDTVLYSTGYRVGLPFLTKNDDHIIEFDESEPNKYFGPLYKRIFAINEPRLMFIGFNSRNLFAVLPTIERTIMIAKQVSQGLVQLPSKEKMHVELDFELKRLQEEWKTEKSGYYDFNLFGYNSEMYQQELLKMNVLEEDKSYQVMAPVVRNTIALVLQGNYGQIKTYDYEQHLKGIPHNPTATKF